MKNIIFLLVLTGCVLPPEPQNCPPKSDNQVLIESLHDLIQPTFRYGC